MKTTTKILICLLLFNVIFCVSIVCGQEGQWGSKNQSIEQHSNVPQKMSTLGDNALPAVKKWLMILSTLAGISFIFLILTFITGGGLIPDDLENLLTKIATTILGVTILLYLNAFSGHVIFLILVPFVIGGVLWSIVSQKITKEYKRKFGKASSPDFWICRKCGYENYIINIECDKCGKRKSAD